MTDIRKNNFSPVGENQALKANEKDLSPSYKYVSEAGIDALTGEQRADFGLKDSFVNVQDQTCRARGPTRKQFWAAAGSVFAGVFCYPYVAPLLETKELKYQPAKDRLQAVSGGYANVLGIKPPKIIIHNSLPQTNAYQPLDYPSLGFANVLSIGKDAIDKISEGEQDCWVAHEMGHSCKKTSDCILPAHFELYSSFDMPHQRELKADYIGSLLCGKENFIDTMKKAREREEKESWIGTWITPLNDHLMQYVYSHPSFNSRAQNVLKSSAQFYPQGYSKVVFPSGIAASIVFSSSLLFWAFRG